MAIQFEYRAGILEAGEPETDREWVWFRGDTEATKSAGGVLVGVLSVPPGATVGEAKAAIRADAKRR